jgi:hypothetical protein
MTVTTDFVPNRDFCSGGDGDAAVDNSTAGAVRHRNNSTSRIDVSTSGSDVREGGGEVKVA